jgi:hypothetical protein
MINSKLKKDNRELKAFKRAHKQNNPDQSQMESVMDYLHMEKMADMDDSPDQYSQLGSIKESPKNKGKSTINDLEK